MSWETNYEHINLRKLFNIYIYIYVVLFSWLSVYQYLTVLFFAGYLMDIEKWTKLESVFFQNIKTSIYQRTLCLAKLDG